MKNVRALNAIFVIFCTISGLSQQMRAAPLRILQVRGLWFDYYQVDRSLARLGGARTRDSWHNLQAGWGIPKPVDNFRTGLVEFPGDVDLLQRYQAVVVCNINGNAFGKANAEHLAEYVKGGGSVLFLGGKFAFGPEYDGTVLEEICPVDFAPEPDLIHAPDGVVLGRGKGPLAESLTDISWDEEPRLYWYHQMTAKPGSQVVLTADGNPVCFAGTYGKGRVIVFAGSVMGEVGDGQLALWEWQGWPLVQARLLEWLMKAELSDATDETAENGIADELLDRMMATAGNQKAREAMLIELAPDCNSADAAALLLEAALTEKDLSPQSALAVYEGVRSYINAEMTDLALSLVHSGRAIQAGLGLRALGLTGGPGSAAILREALETGEVSALQDSDDDMGLLNPDVSVRSSAREIIQAAAIEGLGNLGAPDAVDSLLRFARQKDHPLQNEAVAAAFRCGDSSAAVQIVNRYLAMVYECIRIRSVLDSPDYDLPTLVQAKKRARLQLPVVLQQRDTLIDRSVDPPQSVLGALAKRLAEEQDPNVLPLGFAVFGRESRHSGEPLPPQVLEVLKDSRLPALRDLAQWTQGE